MDLSDLSVRLCHPLCIVILLMLSMLVEEALRQVREKQGNVRENSRTL